jgi:hypothetical protein
MNMKRKETINKIQLFVTNRTILGAAFLAIALWFYASMNEEYNTKISVPLFVELPQSRAFEAAIESTLEIDVRSNGWNLFGALVMNTSKQCVIDLTNKIITDSIFIIPRSDIIKGIQSLDDVNLMEVNPEFIALKTSKIAEKKVPLLSRLNISPKTGYVQVGEVKLEPDSILISGNANLINQIDSWWTQEEIVAENFAPIEGTTLVSDSLKGFLKFEFPEVSYSVDIQLLADFTYYDVRIATQGGSLDKNQILSPRNVNVTVSGGINVIRNINPDSIKVELHYSDIINSIGGILKPKVELPQNLKLMRVDPPYIYYTRTKKIQNLSNL